ncbi:MAG: helix-turn-helix transcriptional regulator [Spirochaetia bacterium]|jgi:transcriptional regulator with XRE-family HTH domain|nr:helix-turn-helix transcriptional regulator [Spirochaetia bacterium]
MKGKYIKTIFRDDYSILIQKLIIVRKECKLTQQEVADSLGWRQDYISKLEAKQRRLDILELHDLAKIYNKDINFFISHFS